MDKSEKHEGRRNYRKMNYEIKREIKEAKKMSWKNQCKDIEERKEKAEHTYFYK